MSGQIERIVELAKLTGRLNDPILRAQLRRLELSHEPALEQLLLRQLSAAAGDEAFDPQAFRPIPPEEMVQPDTEHIPYIEWGKVARFTCSEIRTSGPFRLPLLCRHGLLAGSTRSGKSSATACFVKQLPAGTKCWVFDSENDPVYSNLACTCGAEFYVLDVAELKRNILEPPPGCPQEVWFSHVKRNLRESCFLRDGSIAMLTVLLERCYQEARNGPVALRQVYDKLIELRYRLMQAGREYTFYETLKNRLEGLLVNKMFDCIKGFDLAQLARKNVLFQCASLGSDEYPLFVNDMLSWLSCYFEPSLNPVPKLVVVLEEVHRLTNAQRLRRADIAEPIILDAVRTLAKRGVALMFVDQVPSELPVQVLANCSFRAIFNTIEGRDLDALQRSMSLSYEQRAVVSRLPQRVCVVQYSNPRFPEPFLVAIDEFALRQDISDEVKSLRAATLERLSYVPIARIQAQASQAVVESQPLISKPALDYMIEIAKDQFLAASKRDQDLGIPLSQGNALRKELVAAGLVCLERVNTYGKARKILNTRITDKGYALLKSMKIACDPPKGRGSWEHRFHQRSLAAWATLAGFHTAIEHQQDGKSVDVCLEKGGRRIAAEILCFGVEKELNNLRDLHNGYSEVWFCVKDWDEAKRLQELIRLRFREEAKPILARVNFKLLGQFQDLLSVQQSAGARP